jgi:hypothetical protein
LKSKEMSSSNFPQVAGQFHGATGGKNQCVWST